MNQLKAWHVWFGVVGLVISSLISTHVIPHGGRAEAICMAIQMVINGLAIKMASDWTSPIAVATDETKSNE